MFRPITVTIGIVVLGPIFAKPCLAEDLKFVGFTTERFTGFAEYFAPHQACARQYHGAVWCTSKMIIENGPHALAPSDDGVGWINPVFVGARSFEDTSTG